MRSEAYGSFAYAYDQALGQRFFRAIRRLLINVVEKHPPKRRTHLDIACGTALAMKFFQSRGYRSVGVDASLPMLQIGRQRAHRVVAADMRALPLRGKFARVTCLYDSLNHLKMRNDLVAAFRAIGEVMDDDALFLFDVNHPDIYPQIWGNDEPFVAEGPDFYLEMGTKFRRSDRIAQALVTGWANVAGERVQIHERREQRAYSEGEIIEALAAAGMVPLEMAAFDPFGEGRSVKLFWIAEQQRRPGR
jgi:SAM-dependent methyltransferase